MSQSKDPLNVLVPDRQRELFKRFAESANGFSTEDVIGAAANVLVNALRQAHGSRQSAEKSFDELFGRTKQILVEHYDTIGRKRGIFPFNQTIEVPLFANKNKF